MKTMRFVLGLSVLLFSLDSRAAGHWPQYRGPNASGVLDGKELPVSWDVEKGSNIRWRTPIPGLAHAAPIVWGNRVYAATAASGTKADLKVGLYGDIGAAEDQGPQQWRLLCLDADKGKVIWDKLGYEGAPRVKRHTKASHCNSTPATDGKRIVAIFGSEGLFCFDMDGAVVWQKDLGPMDSGFFAIPTAQWGFASSPIIHEGKVIVLCDVQTNSFLAAFDLKDGNEIWRTARSDVPTWGTPTIATAGRQTQILVNGWHHSGGYDFASGAEIWKFDGGGDIPVPTPVVADGLGIFTSAHGRFRPMQAIRLSEARGDITVPLGETNAAIAWSHPRQGNYMQTPIVVGESLYGCADQGVLTCFDAKTGKIHFSERLSSRGEGFTASPVSDGKHLYFTSELGNVYVVPAKTAFSVAATNQLGETFMSTPAIADGVLFFRTREHLVAVGKKGR